MKQLILSLIILLPACAPERKPLSPVSESQPCTCLFFRTGHEYLLTDIQVVDEETNSSKRALETWKEIDADFDLSFDLVNKKSLSLSGKVLLPFLDKDGVRYFRVIRLDQKGDKKDYEKFVAEYCIQYDLLKDPTNCEIAPRHLEKFQAETQKLAELYLRQAKTGNAPEKETGKTPIPQKVRILFPEGSDKPSLDIRPAPQKVECGLISCEVWVLPGDYTISLHSGESSWKARFSESSGVVAGNRFTKN